MTKVVDRRAALVLLGAGTTLSATRRARAQTLEKVIYQMGWIPQAEQGGFHQAAATGIYRDYGLDVELRKGGPQVDTNAPLLAGRVDFTEANGFSVLNYVREKLPGIAVASMFQKDPRVLISHPGVGNDTLDALKGKPILIATVGRQTYWPWLKAKYGYMDEQARPYTFSMAPFLADKRLTQQGLATSEPYDLRVAGVEPVVHLLADHGFDNYQSVLMTSRRMVADKPELVQRFVEASLKGWASFLDGDPSPAFAAIKAGNPDMSEEKMAFCRDALKASAVLSGGDAGRLGLGAMTTERWERFNRDMAAAGAQPDALEVKTGYTLRFVNQRVGLK